jgi:hypothetical protein
MPADTIMPAASRTDMSGPAQMIEVVMMSEACTFVSFKEESEILYDGYASKVFGATIARRLSSPRTTTLTRTVLRIELSVSFASISFCPSRDFTRRPPNRDMCTTWVNIPDRSSPSCRRLLDSPPRTTDLYVERILVLAVSDIDTNGHPQLAGDQVAEPCADTCYVLCLRKAFQPSQPRQSPLRTLADRA